MNPDQPATPPTAVLPPDVRQVGPLPRQERSAYLEARLEYARAEYNAWHYDEVSKLLDPLLNEAARAESNSPADRLLLASALSLKGRLSWRLKDEYTMHQAFEAALAIFEQPELRETRERSSRRRIDYGITLSRTGHFERALKVLTAAARIGSALPELYAYIGWSLSNVGKLERAIETYDKGLQLLPGDRTLLSWRAETLLKAATESPAFVRDAVDACCAAATAAPELKDAMDWLARAMALGPEDPKPLSIAVTRLRAHARLAQALALIDNVLDRPVGPETDIGNWAIALKGLVLRDLARDADAVALLERVRVAGPDLGWVLITLAEALRALAPDRALEYLARAKLLVPEDLRATILEAQIRGDRDLAAAISALEEERGRHRSSEAVHAALARLLIDADRISEAWEIVFDGLQIAPDSPLLLITQARLFEAEDNHEQAINSYIKAFRMAPADTEVLETVVSRLERGNHAEHALSLLEHAAQSGTASWRVHWHLGRLLAVDGRHAEAVEALRTAAKTSMNRPEVLVALGLTLRRLQQYPEAVAAYDDALLSDPASVAALGNKAVLEVERARYGEAARLLEQAVDIAARDGAKFTDKEVAWLYNGWGWALRCERKASPQTVMEKFAESIRRDPDDPWPKASLASLMIRNQQDEEGRERIRELLQIESAPSSLRGWCHYMLEQYEEFHPLPAALDPPHARRPRRPIRPRPGSSRRRPLRCRRGIRPRPRRDGQTVRTVASRFARGGGDGSVRRD